MSARLLLAPAASGKTAHCIARIQSLRRAAPLANIWVVLPNHAQVSAFRLRLAERGGALGVRLGTFYALYAELLAEAGQLIAPLDEPIIYRLLRDAAANLHAAGVLPFFAGVRAKPGFIRALHASIQELKRARISPEVFAEKVRGRSARLEELGRIYSAYHERVRASGWADGEGQCWLAALALEEKPRLARDWQLLVVDGFDEFNPTQLEVVRLLAERVGETLITLTGAERGEHQRLAHRRFTRARQQLEIALQDLSELALSLPDGLVSDAHAVFARLEAALFEPEQAGTEHFRDAARADASSPHPIEFLRAPTRSAEVRAALRWLKARVLRDGFAARDVALIARDVAPYRPYIEQIALEFGMPLRFGEGAPLVANPAIAALLNLLALPLQDFPRRLVVDAWRSPYFDLRAQAIDSGDAERLDAAARWGQVIAGNAQWQDTLTRLARAAQNEAEADDEGAPLTAPIGAAATALLQKFQSFVARVTPNIASPTPQRGTRFIPDAGRGPARGGDIAPTPNLPSTIRDYAAWIESLIGPDPELQTPWETESDDGLRIVARAREAIATCERDVVALRGFKDVLRALVLGESVLTGEPRRITYEEFWNELRGAVEAATYQAPAPPDYDAVFVLSALGARGLSFRAVALIGMAEGEFPRAASEDPLLTEADRAFLALTPRLSGDEVTFFYEAIMRARARLLLTRPYLADDGQPWEASPYWDHVLSLTGAPESSARPEDTLPAHDAASLAELISTHVMAGPAASLSPNAATQSPFGAETASAHELVLRLPEDVRLTVPDALSRIRAAHHGAQVLAARMADQAHGPHEGELASLRARLRRDYPPSRAWSASRLETLGTCGFAYFTSYALGLEPRPPAEAGYDVRQLGTMYHAILETLFRNAADPTDLNALLDDLPGVAHAVFAAAPAEHGFRPTPLWQRQRAELERILAETVRELVEASAGWRPIHYELAFGKGDAPPLVLRGEDGAEIRLRGYIDRVDANVNSQMRVVDYKAGSTPISQRDLDEGRRLQLALYALALREALQLGEVSAGLYWHIGSAKASNLRLEKYPGGAEMALNVATHHARAHVARALSGDFAPRPPKDGCPSWCPATAFCWRYKPKHS